MVRFNGERDLSWEPVYSFAETAGFFKDAVEENLNKRRSAGKARSSVVG